MNYNLEIQKILLKVEQMEKFSDKVVALKEAIQIADQHNDIDWGFDLRLDLIRNERNTSRCEESFPAFAWILATSDKNEGYFEESDFLWEYKWMFCSAYRNVSIPLEQVLEIGEDLKARLTKNGYSLRAYYNVMTGLHLHLRDYAKAQEYVALADNEVIDDMTNCPACELDTKVEILVDLGKMEEALAKAQDLINKKLTCYSMPFQTFCCFAYNLYLLEDDRATTYFDKALEEYYAHDKYDSSVGYSMAQLICYMHATNHPDTWTFFSRVAEWQLGAEDVHIYSFARYMSVITKGKGEVNLALSPQLPYYRADGVYDISVLHAYFKQLAFEYADAFDRRNKQDGVYRQEVESLLR
ncbi:hypothetical protein VSO92_01425 [Myroides pelagicus]|uniref:hypothetical protein n=1 Tax=Myroides pelagicus TaxID=270914 RepID=UPI002DB82545|nr:hypothetical protein [Myroides pelagicus]MEC4112774.1 hypothetical protein [Myroides pelagicus]